VACARFEAALVRQATQLYGSPDHGIGGGLRDPCFERHRPIPNFIMVAVIACRAKIGLFLPQCRDFLLGGNQPRVSWGKRGRAFHSCSRRS